MLSRDSEVRRTWWAVTGNDKALGDRGQEIAAGMAGPGDMVSGGEARESFEKKNTCFVPNPRVSVRLSSCPGDWCVRERRSIFGRKPFASFVGKKTKCSFEIILFLKVSKKKRLFFQTLVAGVMVHRARFDVMRAREAVKF